MYQEAIVASSLAVFALGVLAGFVLMLARYLRLVEIPSRANKELRRFEYVFEGKTYVDADDTRFEGGGPAERLYDTVVYVDPRTPSVVVGRHLSPGIADDLLVGFIGSFFSLAFAAAFGWRAYAVATGRPSPSLLAIAGSGAALLAAVSAVAVRTTSH